MENCNMCTHNRVCRLKNIYEKICKKINECLDMTTDKEESFEAGQFEIEIKCKDFELAIPKIKEIDIREIDTNKLIDTGKGFDFPKTSSPCEGCSFYARLQKDGIYVGDSPCQWCDKNPCKVTCS